METKQQHYWGAEATLIITFRILHTSCYTNYSTYGVNWVMQGPSARGRRHYHITSYTLPEEEDIITLLVT